MIDPAWAGSIIKIWTAWSFLEERPASSTWERMNGY